MKRAWAGVAGAVVLCAFIFSADSYPGAKVSSTEIPQGVILIWSGTNAGIPGGWTRETALDGRFPKGAANGVEPNGTGGTATHTHSSPTHTHAINGHTHTVDFNQYNGGTNDEGGSSGIGETQNSHKHNGTSGTTTGGTLSDAISYAAASSDPPYHGVIFIKAQTGATLQDDMVALWNRTSEPSGWFFCDGSDSTPDLRNIYLRGAATGGNAGGTGGMLNHAHTVDHGHTAVSHYHGGRSGARYEGGCDGDCGGGSQSDTCNHTHLFTLANASNSVNGYAGTAGTAETVEPVYKKLSPIQKKTGGMKEQGMIGLWLGAVADIPNGWLLCNGQTWGDGVTTTPDLRDYFLKCANTTAEGLGSTTGGSNAHTHAASNSHTHTATATHTHSGSAQASDSGSCMTGVGEHNNNSAGHTHTATAATSAATSTWQNSTIAANSSSNEPEYRTVVFIQSTNSPPTAFSLTAPPDQAQTNDNTPAFTWQESTDPESEPVTYTLKLSTTAGFTEPVYRTVSGLSSAAHTPVTGIADGGYSWKVIASDGEVETQSTQTWQLTVDTQTPVAPVFSSMYPDFATRKITKIYGAGENGTTLTFHDGNNNTIPGTIEWSGGNFTFTPATPLDPGSSVHVESRDGAANTSQSSTGVVSFDFVKDVFEDGAVYRGTVPGTSIRLEKNTLYEFNVAANEGESVTVSAWLMYNPAYDGSGADAPRITLSGLGITAGNTASMTAPASYTPGTWEELAVSGTPNAQGILTLRVETFSTAEGAKTWLDDVAVAQE